MVFGVKSLRFGWIVGVFALLGMHGASAAHGGRHPEDDRGGGGQPDPLTLFNQHVELADGELYLLKGNVVMAPGLTWGSRKLQPYFTVDLDAQPWLSGKQRKESPLYLIEGPLSSWRPYDGSYGQLAAEAHVQLFVTGAGTAVQVISLKPIPELCSIPQRY